jgi:hypothetical protein
MFWKVVAAARDVPVVGWARLTVEFRNLRTDVTPLSTVLVDLEAPLTDESVEAACVTAASQASKIAKTQAASAEVSGFVNREGEVV